MSATSYWLSRLVEGKALYRIEDMHEWYDYRHDAPWPKEVARKALYMNYLEWSADHSRETVSERAFYRELGPLIYRDKKTQVRNRKCWEFRVARGIGPVRVRVSRYFVKMMPLGEAIALFEKKSGALIVHPMRRVEHILQVA